MEEKRRVCVVMCGGTERKVTEVDKKEEDQLYYQTEEWNCNRMKN